MREIKLTKQAQKFITHLPPKQKRQIASRVLLLAQDVQPVDSKKLIGYDYFRVDCGEYRIIYQYDETSVFVYIIGKRNDSDVYRRLERGV